MKFSAFTYQNKLENIFFGSTLLMFSSILHWLQADSEVSDDGADLQIVKLFVNLKPVQNLRKTSVNKLCRKKYSPIYFICKRRKLHYETKVSSFLVFRVVVPFFQKIVNSQTHNKIDFTLHAETFPTSLYCTRPQ